MATDHCGKRIIEIVCDAASKVAKQTPSSDFVGGHLEFSKARRIALRPLFEGFVQMRQRCGGVLLVIDVGVGAYRGIISPAGPKSARRGRRAIETSGVRPPEAKFGLVGFTGRQRLCPSGSGSRNIVGMDDICRSPGHPVHPGAAPLFCRVCALNGSSNPSGGEVQTWFDIASAMSELRFTFPFRPIWLVNAANPGR